LEAYREYLHGLKILYERQLFESSLLAEVQHKGVESAFLNGIQLWSSIRSEQFVHAELGASESIQRAGGFPGASRITVNDTAGQMLFLAEKLHRDLLLEEIAALEINLVIVETGGERLGVLPDAHKHAL